MIEHLACSLGRNDEIPNIELAVQICEEEDLAGIKEIVTGLQKGDKKIANDCIKVLYEIGTRKPELIADYAGDFMDLLISRNNRLVWGGMTALSTIADINPDIIYQNLEKVLSAYRNGSVITIDNSITVLAKLCKANNIYMQRIFPLLMEHLETCRPKEVAQHAERVMECINNENIDDFLDTIAKRKEVLSPPQRKRIDKLERLLAKDILNKREVRNED